MGTSRSKLVRELAKVVVDLGAIRTYGRENLEHPDLVVEHGSARLFWSAVVERAEREGRVTPLVEEVLKDNPGASRLREVLHDWLRSHTGDAADAPLAVGDGEPQGLGAQAPSNFGAKAPWRLVAALGALLLVGGVVWVRRASLANDEVATRRVVNAAVAAASLAEASGESQTEPSTATNVSTGVHSTALPNSGSKLPASDGEGAFVHVPPGEFEPGTPDLRSALAACTEVEGDAKACERWLGREVSGVHRKVAAFDLDRTEVTTEAFAMWLTRGIESGRFGVAGDAVVLASEALWRLTAGFGALALTKGAGIARVAFSREHAQLPITGVTHLGAREYCESRAARLPTALEWEFAARGSRGRSFVWELAPSCEQVAYGRRPAGQQRTAICAGFPERPNAVGSSAVDESWSGVRDLGTNVSEWVADRYLDPTDDKCSGRSAGSACYIIKGGSFADPLFVARPAAITRAASDAAFAHVGFRCARSTSEAR